MQRSFRALLSALCVLSCAATPLTSSGRPLSSLTSQPSFTAALTPLAVVRHGNTPVHLDARLLLNGNPLAPNTSVAVTLTGDAVFPSGKKTFSEETGATGDLGFAIVPGATAGPILVRFDLSHVSTTTTLLQRSATPRPLVVGYATAGMGAVPGNIEAPDNAPNGTNTREGAVSVYGTGRIARNTRGTFAYDSTDSLEQTLGQGPFLNNPNDRPFPVYGDTSLRYDDALSLNRWYARIDNGDTSAQWGQFYASSGVPAPAGGYTALLNGASLRFGGRALHGSAFTAENKFEYARQLLSPTGLGIADQTLHPDIVVGSDVFTLVHLDARTGAVLSQTSLVEGSDYVLDYASGLVRFTSIILPYDAELNPQVVVAQYEYGGAGASTKLSGGTAAWSISKTAGFQSWYLNDATGASNLDLFGQAFRMKTAGIDFTVSHERSNGFLPQLVSASASAGGDAYGVSFKTRGVRSSYGLEYADTAAGYQNPFGPYASAGLRSLRATSKWMLSSIASLAAVVTSAKNDFPGAGQQTVDNSEGEASLRLNVKPNRRLAYHLGVNDVAGYANGTLPNTLVPTLPTLGVQGSMIVPPMLGLNAYEPGSGHALQADAGLRWNVTGRAALSLDRTSDLSASVDPYAPPQTSAQLDLAVGNDGRAFLRQSWFDQSAEPVAASQIGPAYAATARSSTSFGFDRKAGSATIESGYAVDHTASGSDLYDAIGVSTAIASNKHFSEDAFLQVGQELTPATGAVGISGSPFFVVGGTTFNYQHQTFKSSGAISFRTGYAGGSTLQLGAAGPVSPAVSLFGSYQGDYTSLVSNEEARGGLAYRPSRNDRYVTLLSVDTFQSNLTNYDAYITNVAQLQELYRSSTRTEWAGSLAYKLTGDAFFAPHTGIYGLRGDQRIGSRLDAGAEYHWSDVAPIAGSVATGFDAEIGYRIGATLRVAAGYNFSGFADPATAVNPTHRGLYVTMSTYIDRIFGWGEDHHK